MSTVLPKVRALLQILLVDLAALPSVLFASAGFIAALASGDLRHMEPPLWFLAAVDGVALLAFLVGMPPVRPFNEKNLLLQIAARFGTTLGSGAAMLISGLVGAILGANLTAQHTGGSASSWLTDLTGYVLVGASALGSAATLVLLLRAVYGTKHRKRAKALRRGLRAITAAGSNSRLYVPKEHVLLLHFSSSWYLVWLPLLLVITAWVAFYSRKLG